MYSYDGNELLACLLFFNSNTTQSLSGEGDLETEEEAARKILSEAEVIQDSLSNSDTTENKDHGMDTRKEDLELLINYTFVESGEKEPQTTEAVYFLPKAEVIGSSYVFLNIYQDLFNSEA